MSSQNLKMQQDNVKNLQITNKLAIAIKKLRKANNMSLNQLANEYDINKGTLSKIEQGNVNCKFITIWRISQALGLKFSEFAKILEDELGEDFSLIDE